MSSLLRIGITGPGRLGDSCVASKVSQRWSSERMMRRFGLLPLTRGLTPATGAGGAAAFAEELLDAARAAVAHLREHLAELALDREAAFGTRDRRQRIGQVTGIGARMQAPDEGRATRPDPPTDGRVGGAVVVDVLAVVE